MTGSLCNVKCVYSCSSTFTLFLEAVGIKQVNWQNWEEFSITIPCPFRSFAFKHDPSGLNLAAILYIVSCEVVILQACALLFARIRRSMINDQWSMIIHKYWSEALCYHDSFWQIKLHSSWCHVYAFLCRRHAINTAELPTWLRHKRQIVHWLGTQVLISAQTRNHTRSSAS
jgi:hypothetical protein